MKAQSIIRIESILKQQIETAHASYKNIRNNLEQKYETDWLDSVITKEEYEMLYGAKKTYNERCDLYNDFQNHQWQ